jgi:uncharacterized protein (DUF488 family)
VTEAAAVQLFTIGHGADDSSTLRDRLVAAGILSLVDVRRFPGSRRNPDVHVDALSEWVPGAGIEYRWEERLGGRRSLPPGRPVIDSWWRVESFQAYAAYTRTDEFAGGMAELLESTKHARTAVMCSENVWWRCHRRLIADVATLVHGLDVQHLMPDGRLIGHEPAEGARLVDDYHVVWDGDG